MSPRETIVVLNNTQKKIHSVHAENINAYTERNKVAIYYPEISFLVLPLEEALTNITNSLRQQFTECYMGD